MTGRVSLLLFAGALALVQAAPANAQTAEAPRDDAARIVDELAACRGIADAAGRLACFDRTATALVAARDRKDIVFVDREEVRKTRRSLFGFPLPKIKLFGGGDKDEPEIREITSRITSINDIGMGKLAVSLEDGSRWQTTEPHRGGIPRAGDTLRVKRALMGGYFVYLNGALVRAKRID